MEIDKCKHNIVIKGVFFMCKESKIIIKPEPKLKWWNKFKRNGKAT